MGRVNRVEKRLFALLFIFFLSLLGILGRLVFVQAFSSDKYNKEAEQQRLRSIEVPPERGVILDRNGNELAVNTIMDTIYATPSLIEDRKEFAREAASILKVDERKMLNKLIRQTEFTYLARKADPGVSQEIKKLVKKDNIKGIGFLKESKRYYPNSTIGSHVIGFSGMDNHGLSGVELYYDELLYGTAGKIIAERDIAGSLIPRSIQSSSRPKDGVNIRLSIDREIQYKAEVELNAAVKKYEAKAGSIVVMNPENGEIFAIASVPGFNPNKLSTMRDENSRNRAITDLYEPGSTMKVIIACAALAEGLCNPSTAFYVEPTIRIGHKTIKEAHYRPAKTFTFSEIIQESSNVGAVKIGLMLGKERVNEYLENFGFRGKTGVDYPGEATSYYLNVDDWAQTTLANIPFGQGICTNQLMMTRAYSVIANDGVPVKPHFLVEAVDKRGRIVREAPVVREKRVVDESTCVKMRGILEKTVLDGTGGLAKVQNYRVGGKTGTAQKAKVNGRGYEKGKYIASFIGMAPIQDPKLVISVIIDEPKGAIYGGAVAAPTFSKIAEFALRYLKIPPDDEESVVPGP